MTPLPRWLLNAAMALASVSTGMDRYLAEAPTIAEKTLRIDDYVLDFIPSCMRLIRQETGEQDVSLIGYCFGCVLSLIYTAIHE